MTKSELQVALAAATETNKRTAGVFLDTLCTLAHKAIKKDGEFVLPGFGKLVKQKRKARSGFNPKTQQKIKIPAKTVVKFRHYVSFGSFTHYGIAKKNIATERVRAEQSRTISPMKRFLVVVLPDGRVVNPRVADQL